ncbi:MAG: hypothetical protein OEV49_09160 [candidate division Zixibacteria bacterium]|nr:hypothetical protein [candidate division Zixibacteria bacterium]MDH3935770.1 hypothetical protein [candidate division Zixibacteria bacterium]MDH4035817.1 hypothetical protein [candidate division Zixibacteria bacterium]
MESRKRVLWIEDGALFEYKHVSAPVLNSRNYELVIALDATDAERELAGGKFDIVIFDIRLDSGSGKKWRESFASAKGNKEEARLGLVLLYAIFLPEKTTMKLDKSVEWLTQSQVGVLSIETWAELCDHLDDLAISEDAYRNKSQDAGSNILLELIESIEAKQ